MRMLVAVAVLALGTSTARAQQSPIIGSWHGSSTCADREHWPACHDEEVIYDVVARAGVRDTVTLSADKVVNGVRVPMGDLDFAPAADSTWVSEIATGKSRGRVVLRIVRDHMTGTLMDIPTGRTARTLVLDRVHAP